jgi:DNA (cytosine-5)-methyltransferase 1
MGASVEVKGSSQGIDLNLFAGAGGLALGLTAAGFSPSVFFERDAHAWSTLAENELMLKEPPGWDEHRGDVRRVEWSTIQQPVRLLAGGVPCQPFSLAGTHYADRDERDMFPEATQAIAALRPRAFLIENVFGLLREAFRPYFEYILRRLECPSVSPRRHEPWLDHDKRIRRHQRSPGYEPDYVVSWRCVDAADYGVPQNRKRVFIVGTRYGEPTYWFPQPTHSKESLKHRQEDGQYWEERDLARPDVLPWNGRLHDPPEDRLPWVTVFDAIKDLPPPTTAEEASKMNHWTIPGARSYRGHTGSPLHWTSKTIKAGVHGVPGGENTLRTGPNGDVRYYTLREAARIQTFPDRHVFQGARIHVTRQIGNAVPCNLVRQLAAPLWDMLRTT